MEKDFTFKVYKRLLEEIKKTGRPVFSLGDYFMEGRSVPAFFILRHDVDRRSYHALKMAALENELDLRATYYFRIRGGILEEDVIRKVARLGHEIGYHYEVMDKARGQARLAGRLFAAELEMLRSIAEVRTAAMHGNPLTPWDNRDFWKYFHPERFDLLGEAYVGIDDPEIRYVTDTGRGWNRQRYNLLDSFPGGRVRGLARSAGTGDLIGIIRRRRFKKIYIQVHPNRWTWGCLRWYRQWGEDGIINGVKLGLNFIRRRSATS